MDDEDVFDEATRMILNGDTPLDVARFGLEPDGEGVVSPFHTAVVEFLTSITFAVSEPATFSRHVLKTRSQDGSSPLKT